MSRVRPDEAEAQALAVSAEMQRFLDDHVSRGASAMTTPYSSSILFSKPRTSSAIVFQRSAVATLVRPNFITTHGDVATSPQEPNHGFTVGGLQFGY